MSCSEPDRRGRRALLLAALAMPLAGCFRPMLAETEPATALRGRIALPPVDGRIGYHLTLRLEERLGQPQAPDHRLEVTVTTTDRGLAIAQDNSVTRRTVTATAQWRLIGPAEDGSRGPVLSGREVTRSGYNATTSLFASRVAARTVERRLAEDLAERISRDILARADGLAPRAS
ncbi:MAG: LPS assembly lipoprotein LptE [Pseudomonadota bacterium]